MLKLSEGALQDLGVWQEFLFQFNGRAILAKRPIETSDSLHMFSDSSNWGYGACFGEKFFYGPFPASWTKFDIMFKESYRIYMLSKIFRNQLKGKKVVFHTDNQALAVALGKCSCKQPRVMSVLRKIVAVCLHENIMFDAIHIPGKINVLCDRLSRDQVPFELLLEKGMDTTPVSVPQALRPRNYWM